MKLELKPEILEVVQRQGVTATNAGMSKDGQISWIYTAGFLEVTLSHTDKILATWRFGKILKDLHTTITCVTDLTFGGDYLLVVATSSLSDQGTLNIFSVGLRKVVRAVEVPQRVTALDVVFTNVTEDVPDWILSKHLQFFSGLVAVGTESGYIYLVDLCLDELTVNHSTEAMPKKLSVISPSIVDPKAKKEQARLYDRQLAMLLDDQCHRQGQFYYRRQDDTIQKVLDEDSVTVTSIKYLSQAGTLAVGYNFGSFQLWRLYNPVLDYSSRFSPDGVAVSHFVVQEPENDPRNFVYLWVGHDDLTGDSVSSVCLYQLCFSRKTIYASFGMYYDELESVCARLDHKLTLDPYSSDTKSTRSSSIVNCYTIVNPYYTPPSKLSDSFEEGLHSNDLSLSVFVWRAEGKRAGAATKHWMCIFDLNRWYHAQMPHTLRCYGTSLQVCSYWVACNLDEVVSLTSSSSSLLGVGISGDKVLRFINNSALPPEEHSYPSALQLTSLQFITSDQCIRARCDGWQGQLLCQFAHNGAEILVQPADFYHQCHRARLLPQNYEELKTSTIDYQRTVLLNMALEHGITSTLVPQCIQQWADGEFAEQGCSLSFLLDWAWNKVVNIKQSWDSTCEMLYDWSGHHLDPRTDWQLESLTESLSNLKQIFSALVAQSSPTTERGEIEMELRQDVISILLLHCNVVRWCVSFNLLPEIDEASDLQPGLFPYPSNSLHNIYTKKRVELGSIKGVVKDFSLLLIDDLLDLQGPQIKQLWKTLGGNGLYPPPSLQALVNMYLIEEVSTEVKHAITLYLLQDLAALTKDEAGEAVIASFIQRFMLSPGLVHQIQGLWFIDHRDFEEGVRHLVNPNIHEDLGGSWQHAAVVNTLLAQSEGKAATRYIHTKHILGGCPQEKQLYISVLLNNRQVSQALEYMRGCQNETNSRQLLDHLLNECYRYKLLGSLLQVNLTDSEEVYLEQYLRGRAEPHALEPLFLYYLHHSRFLQAYQLNEDMKKMDRLETSLAVQERAATRNRLMEAFLKALPDVTCKLLMEKQRESISAAKRIEVQRPKPLSTRVHNSDQVAMSRSRFVMAVLEKVTEAQNVDTIDTTDVTGDEIAGDITEMSRSNVPFLSTPRTPRHKQHSRISEVIYPDLKLSPLATNPLSAIKRKTLLDYKHEHLNGNVSLRQLTEECLQLLHTPVRNHKTTVPGLADTVSHIKTPQSILKVQRLSKTLLSNSKDKLSARRSSGPRLTRLGFSDTSPKTSPANSPSVETASSTPRLASSESTAVKHLRFVGVSPSPTPSPTAVTGLFSSDKSKEVVEMEDMSSSWQQCAKPPESLSSSADSVFEEASATVPVSSEEHLPAARDHKILFEISSSEPSVKDVLHLERDHQSFVEGPSDRYLSALEELARPDLLSQWKHGQLHSHIAVSSSFADSTNSITVSKPIEEEEAMEVMDETKRSKDSQITTTHTHEGVEQVSSSYTSSFSHEVVKTTTRYVQLSVDSNFPASFQQSSLSPMKSSTRNLSPLLTSSSLNLRSQKSASISPISVNTEVDIFKKPAGTDSKRNDSPPATPPSSKRAKLLESRAKEFESVRKSVRSSSSPEMSDPDDSRRRKTPVRSSSRNPEHEALPRRTPERKSPSRKTKELGSDKVDEEFERRTPERRSPSRKIQKLGGDEVGEFERTPERRSPSRKIQKLEDDRISEEGQRKTPERKSSRYLKKQDDILFEEAQRRTPERKSPSRKLQKLEDDKVSEEFPRKTPERKSPSRKLQKLEEDIADEDMQQKSLERKSPSRKLQKLNEDKLDNTKEITVPSPRSQSRTPERQSVTKKLLKLSESEDNKQIISTEPEAINLSMYRNHRKTYTNMAAEDDVKKNDETFGAAADVDISLEMHQKRRSTRLNTPDRLVTEHSGLEPLSPGRGRGRATRTPQKHVDIESKPSPSRRSTRRNVQDLSETIDKSSAKLSPIDLSSKRIVDESADNAGRQIKTKTGEENYVDNVKSLGSQNKIITDEEEGTEVHNLRRTRRQSRTPDRLVANVETFEPLTPTRRSKRLPKSSENLNAVEVESVKTSSESPKRLPKKRASSKEQDTPTTELQSLSPTRKLKSKSKTPERVVAEEFEPAILNESHSRSAKIITEEKSEKTSRRNKEELQESTMRSLRQKTPDRQFKDTDSEQVMEDDAESNITRINRSRRSPARQTKSPARQTRSPARKTKNKDEGVEDKRKEENNGDENADGWSEEMPALRFDVEDESNSEDNNQQSDVDVARTRTVERQSETPERFFHGHKKGPSSTTSEDPLIASSPGRQTRTAKKTSHEEDLALNITPAFIFSPPLKHSLQTDDREKHSLARMDEGDVQEQMFVFSHPTVAADSNVTGNVEAVAQVKTKSKVQKETKQKSKKKRTLLSYSPILLSPGSPISSRRSQRHQGDSQRTTASTKLRGPRARRIKPSTWTQPTTSRQ